MLKMASLFDGIAGFPLASIRNGIEPIWASEIEPFPIKVSKYHFPDMKHYGDISKINGAEVEPVDIITFGSPCQDMSVAGKRAGMMHEDKGDEETTRSGLFMEAVRIIKEMRDATRIRNTNDEYSDLVVGETADIEGRSTRNGVCCDSGGTDADNLRNEWRRDSEMGIGNDTNAESGKARLYCNDRENGTDGIRPRFAVWENVPGAYSSNKGQDFRVVLEEMCRIKDHSASISMPVKDKWTGNGTIVGDGYSIAWRTLDAQHWGVPQRRKRIFLVADFGGQSAPEILFKSESVSGYSQENSEKRQGTSKDAERSTSSTIGHGVSGGFCAGLQGKAGAEASICYGENISTSLVKTKEAMVVMGFDSYNQITYENVSQTLKAHEGGDSIAKVVIPTSPVAFDCRNLKVTPESGTLQAKSNGGQSLNYINPVVIPINDQATHENGYSNGSMVGNVGDAMYSLTSTDRHAVAVSPKTLKIRSGCEGGEKGALIQDNLSATLGCNNDQTLFVPNPLMIEMTSTQNTIVTNGICPTLTARMGTGGNQVNAVMIENHPADSRVKIDDSGTCQTLTTRMGTGGGNVPMMMQTFAQQRSDEYKESDVACTQAARQYKDSTDLVTNAMRVRRLTPKECERLQGFPEFAKLEVSEMTKDEFIAFNLINGNIFVDKETGEIFARRGPGGRILSDPIKLNGTVMPSGYKVISIRCGETKMQCRVSRIIWISCYGVPREGMVVDHIDNNKLNNSIYNLQLLTPGQNSTKAKYDGLYLRGDENPATKLSESKRPEIVELYNTGEYTMRQLAERFNISKSRIQQIVTTFGWTDIEKASDSGRYKALGNSVAIPCVEFVIEGIARVLSS